VGFVFINPKFQSAWSSGQSDLTGTPVWSGSYLLALADGKAQNVHRFGNGTASQIEQFADFCLQSVLRLFGINRDVVMREVEGAVLGNGGF